MEKEKRKIKANSYKRKEKNRFSFLNRVIYFHIPLFWGTFAEFFCKFLKTRSNEKRKRSRLQVDLRHSV